MRVRVFVAGPMTALSDDRAVGTIGADFGNPFVREGGQISVLGRIWGQYSQLSAIRKISPYGLDSIFGFSVELWERMK